MSESLDFWRGSAAERRRVGAIVKAPEARGLEHAAITLAIDSTLSVAAAVETLRDLRAIDAERASAGKRRNS
jgi:hypothetical protein